MKIKRFHYLVFTIFSFGFLWFKVSNKETILINPQASFHGEQKLRQTSAELKMSPLQLVVMKALEGVKGTYAVSIENLKTEETFILNEDKEFETGSLYKLWVMAAVYKKIQEGKLSEDEQLSKSIATLNSIFQIDPELAEQTEGTITLTVSEALKQMITISHNYAALLLTEKIKLSTVANFLKENGLNKSKVGTKGDAPKSTASDIALFLEKLYKGELGTEEHRDKMLGLLKNQHLTDGLPKYLPKEKIANKTGEIGPLKHDAGIVFTNNGDYIIVVLSESESPAGAQERIAKLSKAVYDYFR